MNNSNNNHHNTNCSGAYGDVTNGFPTDMKALLQHCSKKKLDKRKLKVERLQMSSCLLVEDLIHNVTEETVSNHF